MPYLNKGWGLGFEGCCSGNRFHHSSGSNGDFGRRVEDLYWIQIGVRLSVWQTVWLRLAPSSSLCLHPWGFCFQLCRCSGLSAAPHSAVFITKRCRFGGRERAAKWGSLEGWRSWPCWCKHWMMPVPPRASNQSIQHLFFFSFPPQSSLLISKEANASAS